MNVGTYFAQATQTPGGGASNATDFQPLTQNPQTAPTNLQPGTVPQSASGQDILNNQNARISVPVSSDEPSFSAVEPAAGGINWPAVLFATVIIVVMVEAFLRIWGRPKTARPQPQIEEPKETLDHKTDTADESTPAVGQTKAEPSVQRPKKPRKSKSKRKRK